MQGLTLGNLQDLRYSCQPFAEPIPQDVCPALQRLHLMGDEVIYPQWALRQQVKTLGCETWALAIRCSQPSDIIAREIIELLAPDGSHEANPTYPVSIWNLQQFPNLRCLRALRSSTSLRLASAESSSEDCKPVVITGSAHDICWLRKLKCEFEDGVDVRLEFTAGPQSCIASIQGNGHPRLCACAACCS